MYLQYFFLIIAYPINSINIEITTENCDLDEMCGS